MKLWKKLAAAALAAIMSLTLLTGCSGGGGGSVSIGGSVDDINGTVVATEDADVLIKWAQECAQEQGVELAKDDELTEAVRILYEYQDKMAEADANNDTELLKKLAEECDTKYNQIMEGRKYTSIVIGANHDTNHFEETIFKSIIRAHFPSLLKEMETKPTKIGGIVYLNEKGERTFVSILSDK